MKKYTVRIQLNGHPAEDRYKLLHSTMERFGGLRIIRADDGRYYHLPHGEYDMPSTYTAVDLQAIVRSAVQPIWPNSQVFVTESGQRAWSGLPEANNSASLLATALAAIR